MQLHEIEPIRWVAYNVKKFVDALKNRKLKKQWMKHGITVKLREGGVLHFATYKDTAEALAILYNTEVSAEAVRNSVRFNKPLTVKVDIATITKRKEVK
jgi:hypothetical protein